jgi:hypothetical protein
MADRFTFQQSPDGQVYIEDTESRGGGLHANLHDPRAPVLQVGSHHTTVIDKLYGPLVGFPIRITIDANAGDWVIEREARGEEWVEAARVPLQLESDFPEDRDAN